MALKYARSGGGNWTADDTWSTTSGGAADTTKPTAADDAVLDANSGAVTIDSGAVCRSLDCDGYTGTLSHPTATALTIGDATSGAGNRALRLASGMTYTLGNANTSSITFLSSSATPQTIDSGGKTTGSFSINTGSFQLVSASTIGSTGGIVHNSGTFDINGQTCSWGSYTSSNSSTRTLTLGASAITITGAGAAWNTAIITNFTFNANTSTITFSGAGVTLSSGGITFNDVVATGSGTFVISGTLNCANFTRTGTAAKTDALNLVSVVIASGTVTLTGNSLTNRLLVHANTPGVVRPITAAVVSLTNVDFMDIAGSGAATWTGTSIGDGQGNSGITFDAPVTRYGVGSGGQSWSSTTTWSASSGGAPGASVPLPQDTVIINASSLATTYSLDMPRAGADINFTGFTGTATTSIVNAIFGSLTFASGMTVGTFDVTFSGRGSHTITSAGKSMRITTFTAPGGTYTLQDAMTVTSSLIQTDGTLTDNNFSVTAVDFTNTSGRTSVLNMGTGTWTITRNTTGTFWNIVNASLTLNASTSAIVLSTALAATRTFTGGGKTYGTLTYTVANSPGSLTIAGANTFTTLNVGSGRILTMPSATTNTIASSGTFNVNGAVNGYVRLPGVSGEYISSPDSAAIALAGDMTAELKMALDDYTITGSHSLINQFNSTGNQRSWDLQLLATGAPIFTFSLDGTGSTSSATATAAITTVVADGATIWLRVTRNSTSGDVRFWTSPDGTTWTQLGATVTTTTGAVFNSNTDLCIGGRNLGTVQPTAVGNFYQARLYTSDLGNGSGTPAFDANLATKTVGANTFTESSSNAATVTINGTLAQAGDGRVSLVSSTGGSAATLSKSSGTVSVDYLSIQDSTATGGAGWYAGANSVNVSGNTGWIFTAANITVNGSSPGEIEYSAYAIKTGRSGITLSEQKLSFYNSQLSMNYYSVLEAEIAFLKNKTGLYTENSLSRLWRTYLVSRGVPLAFSTDEMKANFFANIGFA